MLKLTTETFGRLMREDEPVEELGISSYDRLRDAVKAGDTETALKLIDYVQYDEIKETYDGLFDWAYSTLTWIADNYGEDKLAEALRYGQEKMALAVSDIRSRVKTAKQALALVAEQCRAHRHGPGGRGEVKVWEEEDRYVISADPCGSGGRMRRKESDKIPARTEPPYNMGKTKKAHTWSWSMKDVPYYCAHCCMWHEVMPIEAAGIPRKITEYNPDPNAPCVYYFYKKPELIPEKYYKRVGFEKKSK